MKKLATKNTVKMETINDILAEMRAVDYGVVENDFVKFADRIEEAAKNLSAENKRLRGEIKAKDAIERKKKREKRYEYSVHPAEVYGVFQHRSAAELNVETLKAIGIRAHLVRREVGEWEEVKDGE